MLSALLSFLTGLIEGVFGIDLEQFFASADPTRHFEDSIRQPLIWDFDRKTLNGIAFEDPVEQLQSLGKADRFSSDTYTLHLVYG